MALGGVQVYLPVAQRALHHQSMEVVVGGTAQTQIPRHVLSEEPQSLEEEAVEEAMAVRVEPNV